MPSSRSRFFVLATDAKPYSPANHTGTVNRRLIGQENVGARQVEVVLGVIDKGSGALPHAHPGIEQVCYLLEGRARAEIDGETCDMQPGDCCFFPPDMPHVFTSIGDQPAKVLVIYSPPYGEDPDKVTRGGRRPTARSRASTQRRKDAKTQRRTGSAKYG